MDEVEVEVEVPRGGHVKRRADGGVDYLSPLPCPFNYGCVPDRPGGDGDPLDAVILGGRLPRGTRRILSVHAVVRFVDAGEPDDKLVVAESAPSPADLEQVARFFARYARWKGWLNRLRGKRGETRFDGVEVVGEDGRGGDGQEA